MTQTADGVGFLFSSKMRRRCERSRELRFETHIERRPTADATAATSRATAAGAWCAKDIRRHVVAAAYRALGSSRAVGGDTVRCRRGAAARSRSADTAGTGTADGAAALG